MNYKNKGEVFYVIVKSVNGNPNGDPDANGQPRTTPNQHGIISPVSLKRQIRDVAKMRFGCQIAIDRGHGLSTAEFAEEVLESSGVQLKSKDLKARRKDFQKRPEDGLTVRDKMLEYFDARIFGFMDTSIGFPEIRGCVQIGNGVTPHPIMIDQTSTI